MVASSLHDDPLILTAAGRQQLQERLDRALDALAQLSQQMRAGDRSPEDAAEQQRLTEQVEDLTAVLARARDVGNVDEDPTIVEIGDEVDVEMDDGDVDTYALVHPAEASVTHRRISIASPLGRALMGARTGDVVRVDAPAGSYVCTVRARRRLS